MSPITPPAHRRRPKFREGQKVLVDGSGSTFSGQGYIVLSSVMSLRKGTFVYALSCGPGISCTVDEHRITSFSTGKG